MDDLTEIQITQQRINTICGLVESLKKLYIKVGTLYTVATVTRVGYEQGGKIEELCIRIDNNTLEYPPLFASYEAAEGYMKSLPLNTELRVVEVKLHKPN